jgi:hypothetical protein
MKPGEGLAQILGKDKKLEVGSRNPSVMIGDPIFRIGVVSPEKT